MDKEGPRGLEQFRLSFPAHFPSERRDTNLDGDVLICILVYLVCPYSRLMQRKRASDFPLAQNVESQVEPVYHKMLMGVLLDVVQVTVSGASRVSRCITEGLL